MIPVFRTSEIERVAPPMEAYARVVARGRYVLGPEVDAFEAAWAEYCGTSTAVGVANGTDALELSLRALGIGPGDKVACAANAGFYATAAILAVGATPRYVDIAKGGHALDTAALAAALEEVDAIRAVVVTHLYGRMAPLDRILAVADPLGIPVIEDCAQAHGASLMGRRAGSIGKIGCFSFYPTKNLGATGDGGAVVTSDPVVASRLRALRQYGWTTKYRVRERGGRNSRLDELQAAVLLDRLPFLDRWNDERRSIARRYRVGMAGLAATPPPEPDAADAAHLAVIEVADRDHVRSVLTDHGVATEVHYPIPDHLQEAARPLDGPGGLPRTERACLRVLSLPCFPGMRDAEVEAVVRALRAGIPADGDDA